MQATLKKKLLRHSRRQCSSTYTGHPANPAICYQPRACISKVTQSHTCAQCVDLPTPSPTRRARKPRPPHLGRELAIRASSAARVPLSQRSVRRPMQVASEPCSTAASLFSCSASAVHRSFRHSTVAGAAAGAGAGAAEEVWLTHACMPVA